ncbi:MAG: MBL fold metallo-hydrolase [Pseudomonadota bacterium]
MNRLLPAGAVAIFSLILCACTVTPKVQPAEATTCNVEFVVLGIGQDGGSPQINHSDDPGWADPSLRLWAASGALIDHRHSRRYLFEATPDIREQLHFLDSISSGGNQPLGLAGVFLTHAHIGHYTGLMFAGHESAGASDLPVFALRRMHDFLQSNGPWDQLVRYENIKLTRITNKTALTLGNQLSVTPLEVPHRDEYSETAAFVIQGPSKSVLFLPDIDDWDRWEREYGTKIEDLIAQVDFALLDATFFDNDELPGRDMSLIPHPRVADSIKRFSALPGSEQQKIQFFHINHTNRLRFAKSAESQFVAKRGFKVARRGDRLCLD